MTIDFYTSFPETLSKQWDNFLESHPDRNIFYTKEMITVYEKANKYNPAIVVAADENGIQGILVGLIQKEFKGILGYLSARCIIFGGPLVQNDDPILLSKLLNKYDSKIRKKVIYSQIRNLVLEKPSKEKLKQCGYIFSEHLNIHINLNQKLIEFRATLKSKLRQNIRKAERKGLNFSELENDKDLQTGYKILHAVYRNAGLPLPGFSFFEHVYNSFVPTGKAKFFKAYYKNQMVGVRFVLIYNGLVYDWYAGSYKRYNKLYPNDYLPYKVIEWGIRNENYHLFDFGGAGKPNIPYGVRDHKLKFSQNLIQPGRFEKIHHPIIYKISLLGFKLYRIIKK